MSEETPQSPVPQQQTPPPPSGGQIPGADKKLVAGLLGILIGAFGIHKFYLGYQKEGIIMLVACVTCIGLPIMQIIGLVEGILYLTKSDEEFVATYITNQKTWF